MRYVLDSTVVSALMRKDRGVVAKILALARGDVGVPQPVLAEIAFGIARLPKSKRREALRGEFDLLRADLPRVAWSDEVSETFGVIKAALQNIGQPLEDFDIAIAAHALAYGAILVSANVKHMRRITGLVVEDWSE